MKDPKITMDTVRAANVLTGGAWPNGQALLNAIRDTAQLEAIGRRLTRLGVQQCNGIERWDEKAGLYLASWSEADQEANDKAVDRLRSKARAIAEPYGCKLTFQRDPRGAAIKLGEGEFPI